MAFVVFNVLVAALVVDLLRLGGDGCLHRDDTHDAGAHGGVGCMMDLAVGGMFLERVGDLRMLLAPFTVDEQELENARGVRRQEIDLQAYLRHQHLYHQSDIRQFMQNFLGPFLAHFGPSGDTGDKCRFHAFQGKHNCDLIIRDPLFQRLVFGAVRSDLVMTVIDLFTQFNKILSNFQIVTLLMVADLCAATFFLTV